MNEGLTKVAARAAERAKALGTEIVIDMPDGFRRIEGALTQPNGTYWAGRGSLFDGTHEQVLVWKDWMREAAMDAIGMEVNDG